MSEQAPTIHDNVGSYIIYFDIVTFTLYNPDVQDRMLEYLRLELKRLLRQHGLPFYNEPEKLEHKFYWNSTGDGAVIVLVKDYVDEKGPPAVFDFGATVYRAFSSAFAAEVDKNGEERPGRLRAAIHFGDTRWAYSRVDGTLIVSGEGLNRGRRALDAASLHHFMVTEDYKNLCEHD
ncbi:MAG: hypothetical protein JRC92_11465, partial [Deltaproteobacteria bacterium]|nr:hypothetical protein [Deltaproteobacteria bacterium]